MTVRTATRYTTPLDTYVVWQVDVGDDYTAWYDVDDPHTLIAFDDGMVTWELVAAE